LSAWRPFDQGAFSHLRFRSVKELRTLPVRLGWPHIRALLIMEPG
jgi:hypothetical protein